MVTEHRHLCEMQKNGSSVINATQQLSTCSPLFLRERVHQSFIEFHNKCSSLACGIL
uniref:Uncharacterized protein n=1 Tax=Anguilla anguilla TaxID=7936 RepID=A0A0E9QTF2_ANGAN